MCTLVHEPSSSFTFDCHPFQRIEMFGSSKKMLATSAPAQAAAVKNVSILF